MTTEQPEALQLADDLDAEAGRITQYTNRRGDLLRELAAAELRRQHAEIETLRAGYDAARLEIESLQKAATDRHALQAAGAHPAPCARYCEAQAFHIERRNLHAENERLRTCNKDAQHEIANLQERVQELGQMARDVNSRRVVELEAQLEAVGEGGVGKLAVAHPAQDRAVERLRAALAAPAPPDAPAEAHQLHGDAKLAHDQCRAVVSLANSVAEVYAARAAIVEHDNSLADLIGYASAAAMEWLGDELNAMGAAEEEDEWVDPILDAAQERWPQSSQSTSADAEIDASARFKAQHEFLIWNREQTPPPIESATEYSVFNQAVDFYLAARAAQGGAA